MVIVAVSVVVVVGMLAVVFRVPRLEVFLIVVTAAVVARIF